MKTNKFNSSNSLLAVAVILLVGGIGIGTYYGINETNEINYLKDKSNSILTALNDTEFSKSLSLENDSFKIKDLDTFTSDLYRVFKNTPFIHTFNEPKEINADTLYFYNELGNNTTRFSNIRLYSFKYLKYIDIDVIEKSSYIKPYDIKINLPVKIELEETSTNYIHDGYYSTLFNTIYVYDKDNNLLEGFYNYLNIEVTKNDNCKYHINNNINSFPLVITDYRDGEYEFKVSITDFPNIEPVTFTLSVKTVVFTPEK